jgi:hypothetical protein
MPISLKNTASILPWARYSPRADKLFVAGEDNKPREIPFLGRSFAVDIENGSMGWLLLGKGVRDWQPFPINSVPPLSPGPNYKRGFSVLFYAPKLLGSPEAHEMCASTGAHMSFCERLYNECEPGFDKGAVPIVKIVQAELIEVGRGSSRELHFEIVKRIPRPAAFTEALAKLKTADATSDKNAHKGNGADTVGDDFDEPEDVTKAETTTKPKEASTEKPKSRGKKPPPSSDILDDPIDDIPY